MALISGGPQPPLRITGGVAPPGPYPDHDSGPFYNAALSAMDGLEGHLGGGDPYGPPVRYPTADGMPPGPRNWFPPPGGDPYGPPVQKPPPPSIYPGMAGGPSATAGAGYTLSGVAGDTDKLQRVGQIVPDFTMPHGMNDDFWHRLDSMRNHVLSMGGDIGMFSGVRTPERQQQLYQAALQRYGTDAAARKVVSPPGSSWHEPNAGMAYGLGPGAIAADLHGHLALAHRLAPSYGLEFSKTHPWHVQVAGL